MLSLTLLVGTLLTAGEPVTVGVLEEFAFEFGQPLKPQVRLAFVRTAAGWDVAPQPERVVRQQSGDHRDAGVAATGTGWRVCNAGASVEAITTEPLQSEHYAEKGAQRVVSGKLPFSGERSLEFAGWLNAPVHHPLVATTGEHCADPEGWQGAELSPSVKELLVAAMRATVKVEECDAHGRLHPWAYPETAIRWLQGFRSRSGDVLALAQLQSPTWREENGCPAILGEEWGVHLFFVPKEGPPRLLGGLRVVGFGDFDADGRTEVVTTAGGYNRDGYALLYDRLTKRTTFTWNYH